MLCQCGCGQLAPIAKLSNTKHGRVKGQPCRFISGHNINARMRPNGTGYMRRQSRRYVHIEIAESALGHALPVKAQVHHVDGNKRNNVPSNLVICESLAYHHLLHVRARVVHAGGNPNTQRICSHCRELKSFDAFNRSSTCLSDGRHRICRSCAKSYMDAYRARRKAA